MASLLSSSWPVMSRLDNTAMRISLMFTCLALARVASGLVPAGHSRRGFLGNLGAAGGAIAVGVGAPSLSRADGGSGPSDWGLKGGGSIVPDTEKLLRHME